MGFGNVHFGHFSLVCIVHCETSSGVINDVSSVAELFEEVNFFIDAMSSFGAVPLDLKNAGWSFSITLLCPLSILACDILPLDFVVSSANKCLEGVPGFGYALCRKSKLDRCKGNSRR